MISININFFGISQKIAKTALGLALLAVPVTATGQTGNRLLAATELPGIFAGNTIKQVDDQYYAYYQPTGKVNAMYVNADQAGAWTVQDNQLCHRWAEWNGSRPSCFMVIKGTQGAYRFYDPTTRDGFIFTIQSGNPLGL